MACTNRRAANARPKQYAPYCIRVARSLIVGANNVQGFLARVNLFQVSQVRYVLRTPGRTFVAFQTLSVDQINCYIAYLNFQTRFKTFSEIHTWQCGQQIDSGRRIAKLDNMIRLQEISGSKS